MPGVVSSQRLEAVVKVPVGMSPSVHLTSRLETTRAQVGFTGISTAHFLEGIKANRRDPLQG